MRIPVLTIDGPSGSGKGTVSRLLAKKLGWHYLDSGALYRSLAIALTKSAVALGDTSGIVRTAQTMSLSFGDGDSPVVRLNGDDVSAELGLETTGNAASIIAAIPAVRMALLQKQRDFKRLPGLVADGRDMGTVVFPDAEYKVFLTASAEKRAERRYKQLKEKGIDANLGHLAKEIAERDRRDMAREAAPLAKADNALFVDSSELSVGSVVLKILNLIR